MPQADKNKATDNMKTNNEAFFIVNSPNLTLLSNFKIQYFMFFVKEGRMLFIVEKIAQILYNKYILNEGGI